MGRTSDYISSARVIANKYGSNLLWVLFRLRYCWYVHGFSASDYAGYDFHSKPFSAPRDYIRKLQLEALQKPLNSTQSREWVDDKVKFFLRCKQHSLPTPDILALVDANTPLHDFPHIKTPTQLLDILQPLDNGQYILKPTRGFVGQGIQRVELRNNSLYNDDGSEIDIDELLNNLLSQDTQFIVQKYHRPHPDLKIIMPRGGLGTIRLITVLKEKKPQISSISTLKIPVGNNATDNFRYGRSGNLCARIDVQTGCITNAKGSDPDHPGFMRTISDHPDNGEPLDGFQIPCWQELLDTASNAAIAFQELGTVGWDIGLTVSGPCLIEGNGRYGIDGHQIDHDRGLKQYFEQLLAS